jgi:hypothetical protein
MCVLLALVLPASLRAGVASGGGALQRHGAHAAAVHLLRGWLAASPRPRTLHFYTP